MPAGLRRLRRITWFGALLIVISGCVTTEEGLFDAKASDTKALATRLELARTYIQNGNWDDAKRNLRIALQLDSESAGVHELLGFVYQNTGEFERADEHFQRAIRAESDNPSRLRNNYAAFLYGQGRFAEAVDQLERVVDDTLYENRALAFLNLGRAQRRLNDNVAAEQSLRRASLMAPGSFETSLEYAEVLFDLERYAESQRAYDYYRSRVRQQRASALWLGIRLAQQSGNQDARASYALALKNLYPTSREWQLYRERFNP